MMASIHLRGSAGWAERTAPDAQVLEMLALEVLAKFPDDVLADIGRIQIMVAEYPEDELLNSMGLEDPSELLGVYETNIFTEAAAKAANIPVYNRFWLFRRPVLDHWAMHGETLATVVGNLLIQELGYSLELTDETLERLDAAIEM